MLEASYERGNERSYWGEGTKGMTEERGNTRKESGEEGSTGVSRRGEEK